MLMLIIAESEEKSIRQGENGKIISPLSKKAIFSRRDDRKFTKNHIDGE
jgi:hypothetical protein